MIELYAAGTGNGQRGAIALEECGVAYHLNKIDLTKGEQQSPEFLSRNPMGQIPVIVDSDGPGGKPLTLSQSGAILLYLAQKSGKFLPKEPALQIRTIEWMLNACTDIAASSATMFQLANFVKEKVPSNIEYYEGRVMKYFGVCEKQLAGNKAVMGEMSIADFALFPIVNARKPLIDKAGNLPNLAKWWETMTARPGIQRALKAFQ
jgi:GSH-dependent disulfide-bond oxidoreductase